MQRLRPTLGSDLAWGLWRSLSIAAVLSAAVAIRNAAFPGAGSTLVRLDTETVVASYFFCALFAGSLVGAARPLLARPVGRAVIGVLAAWPCAFLFEMIEANPTQDLAERAMDTTILAVIYGIVLSIMLGRSRKQPD